MGIYQANLTSSDGTTAQANVGDEFVSGGNHYVYCKATAVAISAYKICSGANFGVMEAATTTTVNALGTAGGCACIPQFDVGASEYFWALVGPFGQTNWTGSATATNKVFAENATAGALLHSTANAGNLDDAVTTPIIGLTITANATTAAATPCVAFRRLGWTK